MSSTRLLIRVSQNHLVRPHRGLIVNTAQRRFRSDETADLGIRSTLPPDSKSNLPSPSNNESQNVPDDEWELRTGRAIYLLTQTLPNFFSTGLIDNPEKLDSSLPLVPASVDSIYSPNIRLAYTPPLELPPPFPQTLHVEGHPLYMASSVFVRHTLNALYSHLHVELRKISVNTPSMSHPRPSNAPTSPQAAGGGPLRRQKNILIGLRVRGNARVSGGPGQWDVNSTYSFSPQTGLILEHRIDSIHPAPHRAVYDALRASLVNVFGLGEPKSAGAAFGGRIKGSR